MLSPMSSTCHGHAAVNVIEITAFAKGYPRPGPGPEGQRMPHLALRFGEDHRLHPLEEARRTCVRPRW
jgi:hypothetical protein